MSSNAYGDDKGAGSAGGAAAGLHTAQAPRLRSTAGSYAAWKPDMEVYLERIGADSVHKRAMTDDSWRRLALQVQSWSDEALALALAAIGELDSAHSDATPSASASATQQASGGVQVSAEQKEQRRLVTALVDRSRRIFGVIWASLPEELRAQAAHVPQGFASGLWQWLQQKFLNTEQDSVGELLAQWVALRQEENESFDAYRARVNQLKSLLEHAKEPQSARMCVFTLLDKLQPRYNQAVLALKAGGQLKEADKIAWDTVTAFINQHERSELRLGTDRDSGVDGAPVAAAARSPGDGFAGRQARGGSQGAGWSKRGGAGDHRRSADPRRSQDTRKCFRCDEQGHIAATCPNPPKGLRGEGGTKHSSARSAPDGAAPAAGEQASAARRVQSNRFGVLSSDDDDDESDEDCVSERSCMAVKAPSNVEAEARGRAAVKSQPKDRTEPKAERVEKSAQPSAAQSVVAAVSSVLPPPKARAVTKLDAALADDAWGWDTMASSCCSGNKDRFISLRNRPAVPVRGMDGNVVTATRTGSVRLRVTTAEGRSESIVVHNVLFHERFACNLLSSELLVKEHGWQYHSTPDTTYVVTPGGHRVNLSSRGRVSVLMGVKSERACPTLGRAAGPTRTTWWTSWCSYTRTSAIWDGPA